MGSLQHTTYKALGHLLWLWRGRKVAKRWYEVGSFKLTWWPDLFEVGGQNLHIMCKKIKSCQISKRLYLYLRKRFYRCPMYRVVSASKLKMHRLCKFWPLRSKGRVARSGEGQRYTRWPASIFKIVLSGVCTAFTSECFQTLRIRYWSRYLQDVFFGFLPIVTSRQVDLQPGPVHLQGEITRPLITFEQKAIDE